MGEIYLANLIVFLLNSLVILNTENANQTTCI